MAGVDDTGEQRDGVVAESHRVPAREQHLAVVADLQATADGLLRIDGLRAVPLQPEDDGVRRAVAGAGRAERAVELDAQACDPPRTCRSSSRSAKRFAARIGPTVCELDGPIPIENRSKTLITPMSSRPQRDSRATACAAAPAERSDFGPRSPTLVGMADRLQEELDALAIRLGRSLTVDGLDGELLVHSTQGDDADQARIASILLRHVTPERRAWEERHVGTDPTGPVAVPANPELGMSARLCVPLRRDGRTLGFLWTLHTDGALGVDEQQTVLRGADVLAAQLDAPAPSSAPGRTTDRLVRRLFDEGHAEALDPLAVMVPGIVEGVVQVVAVVATRSGDGVRPFRPSEFSALTGSLTPTLRSVPAYVGACASMTYALVVLHHRGVADPAPMLAEIEQTVARCLRAFTLGVERSGAARPARRARSTQAGTRRRGAGHP